MAVHGSDKGTGDAEYSQTSKQLVRGVDPIERGESEVALVTCKADKTACIYVIHQNREHSLYFFKYGEGGLGQFSRLAARFAIDAFSEDLPVTVWDAAEMRTLAYALFSGQIND